MFEWLNHLPLWLLGLLLFLLMLAAGSAGFALRRRNERRDPDFNQTRSETQEGYIVASALTLLGLLIGFTFALVVDRYESRRLMVIDHANAIEELYLRATLLDEPHRGRYAGLLLQYTENSIRVVEAGKQEAQQLFADNKRLMTELWTVTVPAFQSVRGIDFSTALVDSVNQVIAVDIARKAARATKIPGAIFAVLFIYVIITAGVLGYVLIGRRGRLAGAILLFLFTLAIMLLSDINRPDTGTIRESQEPMERLLVALKTNPPAQFDRLRPPPATPSP